ncbi:MAG: hypothetical protein QOD63_2044 [Actinomycetota bacterium]|jgi:anti-sigma regulatory factor (Ser/Thr protein kinase)|nr:hypothetical protein [Actinomycetota bacterium]
MRLSWLGEKALGYRSSLQQGVAQTESRALTVERTDDPDHEASGAARSPVRWTGTFPPEAAAVGRCRLAVEEILTGAGVDPGLVGDALVVLGEIAANSVRHAGTAFTVSVATEGASVHLDVFDGDPRPPAMRGLDPGSMGGRGLHIVAGMAADWGWRPAEENGVSGKRVWAEVGGAGGFRR